MNIRLANFGDAADAAALVALLGAYARDPAGGGTAVGAELLARLPAELARRQHAFSVLALAGSEPVGLVNCFEGFSTFACRPLVNVHDVVVLASHRGRRIATLMLEEVEQQARQRGACKLTLEVLSGNAPAMRLYAQQGFAGYQLDPGFGQAVFLQKPLA